MQIQINIESSEILTIQRIIERCEILAIQRNIESSVILTMQRNILHYPSLSFCSCKRQNPCLVLYIEATQRKQRLYISYIRVRQSGIFICKNCMQNTRKLRVKPICDQSMHASLCTMYTCYLLALCCVLCSVYYHL